MSSVANRIREEVAAGRYPANYCETCHKNNTSLKLFQLLNKPLSEYLRLFAAKGWQETDTIEALRPIFQKTTMDGEAQAALADLRE